MYFEFDKKQLQETKSYAVSNAEDSMAMPEDTIDCSMGVNPYGFSKVVEKAYKNFDIRHFINYPHSHVHFDAVKKYWADITKLEDENIFFCNGSVTGIYFLNSVFSKAKRKEAIGFIPTFTDTVESMKNFGMSYRGVPMRLSENGKLHVEDLIDALGPETGIVYIDRPHNPTGQTIPLSDIERLASACMANGSYLFMDEAYGDFIEKSEASVKLFDIYDNIIVLKTFSKGFGLANVRMGYLVADKTLVGILNRLSNPYILNDLEREIIKAILDAEDLPNAHAEDFRKEKEAVRKAIGNRIEMLVTDDRVPICTLHLKDGGDLLSYLKKFKMLAVPGSEYELIDESYVRFRVPEESEMPRLLELLREADK